jgi:group II intron reverse transcriptase/maturase
MNEREQSDEAIVPTKHPNKAAGMDAAKGVEGRASTKRNPAQQTMHRTQSRASMQNALSRIRRKAKIAKREQFTALLHHVTIDRLRDAYAAIRRDAMPGTDGVTWEEYGRNLEQKLRELHRRIHRGAYRAKPNLRAYIPKPDGGERPLGIATLEDKVVQRAVAEVLNAIYEEDFLGFSYGFRPGRGPHNALDALSVGIQRKNVNWVLDADIRGYFDTIDHGWMARFIKHRVGDRRMRRLIDKWLSAGVIENGRRTKCSSGTPQGAPISPLLSNVYLHYVFDLWADQWRKRHAKGDVIIVRFADDIVAGFQYRHEAEQFLRDLNQRFAKFSLNLHPDKTRLVEFGRYAIRYRKQRGERKPETFTFLGFTHICAVGRRGRFYVKRRTSKKRMRVRLRLVKVGIQRRRHLSLAMQGRWLRQVVQGYFAYHAVPTNSTSLDLFRKQVAWHWMRALRRRSQVDRFPWKRFWTLVRRWLPPPRILHPWPSERFDVMHTQGRSPVR